VTDRHTAVDYAQILKELSDKHFPDSKKIVLIQDNLNTHKPASLYEAFPESRALGTPPPATPQSENCGRKGTGGGTEGLDYSLESGDPFALGPRFRGDDERASVFPATVKSLWRFRGVAKESVTVSHWMGRFISCAGVATHHKSGHAGATEGGWGGAGTGGGVTGQRGWHVFTM
jgi:hypothetical protein